MTSLGGAEIILVKLRFFYSYKGSNMTISLRSFSNGLKPLINLKEILTDTIKTKQNAFERRMPINVELIEELNKKRVELSKQLASLNIQRKSSENTQESKLKRKETIKVLSEVEDQLITEISTLPNWSATESPVEDNLIIKPSLADFDPSMRFDHMDICKRFDLVDFEGPARTTGAHFYALKGVTALMEIALTSWSMNRAIQKGFIPISAPDCVRERFVVGCGFQPRRSGKQEQAASLPVYKIDEPEKADDPLVLAGTSEMYLASQHSNQTLKSLPLKYVGVSHCFRSEVGHHTAASRGLYRVHQFTKIELFVLCTEESSHDHFKEITDLQKDLLNELKLPFRVLEMARWELGAAANRKWDHEVWMPGRKIWGEVMSTSNCTDYQSRRLAIRYRDKISGELVFPYTLNGTACAIPRIIMALLEWGWDPQIPEYLNLPAVLEPFYPTNQRKYDNLSIKFV